VANNDKNLVVLEFPLNGIELSCPFDMQPQRTTPIATNVRGLEPLTQRDRGAQRPGLSRYLGQIPTAGKVQFLGFIVDPQADALIADTDQEDPNVGPSFFYITDPSTNNRKMRNPGPRRVRRGGSGRQSNINIGKQSVIITWANPADIVDGTALGGTQLNATAATSLAFPVPGTFVYTPSAGAVLSLGDDQTLATAFTPTDAGLYRTASKTVFINVVPGGIAFINAGGASTSDASSMIAGLGNVAIGDFIVIFATVQNAGSNAITFGVTDSQGNVYSQAVGYVRESYTAGTEFMAMAAFVVRVTVAGSVTVTVSKSASCTSIFNGLIYRGAEALVDAVTNSEHQPAGPTVANTTGSVAAGNGDVIIAAFNVQGAGLSPGSGFTTRASFVEDRIGVSGALAATATSSGSAGSDLGTYVAIGISLRKVP